MNVDKDIELERLRDKLEEQKSQRQRIEMDARTERLEAVAQLGAGLAHEVNNPLTYVLSNIEFVLEELGALGFDDPARAEAKEYLEEAREGAQRIRDIMRDLKALVGAPTDYPCPCSLSAALELAVTMIGKPIRQRAKLTVSIEPVPSVWAAATELNQLCLNLLLNAMQAIPDSGDEARDDHEVHLSVFEDRTGNAVLKVEDTGRDQLSQGKERLFDPYRDFRGPGTGGGLGLTLCHMTISKLGGVIDVEARPGGGTSLTVILPACEDDVAVGDSQDLPAALSVPLTRVLIVDDEPQIVKALSIALRAHDVTSCTSGTEALELLMSSSFDVVFCDLMMPDTSGMEIYERLRQAHPDRAESMVFMTGGAYTEEARIFLKDTPNENIEKPFDAKRVRDIVAERVCGYQ